MATKTPRLYLGYGSNLSTTQMAARCPSSRPIGLAFLPKWTFIINQRGCANVIRELDSTVHALQHLPRGVYGVLYELTDVDEDLLDIYEGVPDAYEKLELNVEVVGSNGKEECVVALVYVDSKRIETAQPREEYVGRMNRGIDEATKEWGLPKWYVDKVMRRFIPPLSAA